jgi:hypothetical protein
VIAGNYEVVVRGRLSPTLIAAFEGFDVTRVEQGSTHLVGWVLDQARLHSTLELLRDLNIELVSVNYLPATHHGRPDNDI